MKGSFQVKHIFYLLSEKKLYQKITIHILALIISSHLLAQSEKIRLNQLGYYPKAPKIAISVIQHVGDEFSVIDAEGTSVFSGRLGKERNWKLSGESVRWIDFSELSKPGIYRVKIGDVESWPFRIGHDVWRAAAVSILKSYYLQRASFELEEEFAGIYLRPAGHPDTACVYHSSSGRDGLLYAPGGWYDAGDFGKYIVSAGVTLGNMMSLYEMIPDIFPDGSINIPESGNSISDLLDEVKVELDWFKYMQDDDGGVFVKITSEKYPDMMFPHEDSLQRNVYGKSTAATLHFAATMAMAARLFHEFSSNWAVDCLKRAESAWSWAIGYPDAIFRNPPGVLSGAYRNDDMSDEFLWAAVELYSATNKASYRQFLLDHIDEFDEMDGSGWADVSGLAVSNMAIHARDKATSFQGRANESLITWSDRQVEALEQSAYAIPDFSLVWGSNGFIAAKGLAILYAYQITKNEKYLEAAAMVADYILGKNATGYCFVTGFGSKKVENLHHSVSIADGIEGSLPGFVPGGPNPSMQDAERSEHGEGLNYDHAEPARAYMDDRRSYASNENDICYSAPVLALIAALDYYYGWEYPEEWEEYYQFPE